MKETVEKKTAAKKKTAAPKDVKLVTAKPSAASSPAKKRAAKSAAPAAKAPKKVAAKTTKKAAEAEAKPASTAAFKTLSEPVLPTLRRANRARLLLQTPTSIYFYWSVRENPWAMLRGVFGDDQGSYLLVLKLTNMTRGSEEVHPAEAEGNWWFNVEPNSEYQAEIGFYAPNRPYFRLVYSNTIETPRRSPSPHSASEAKWTVSANKFAEVLDVAGFSQDAFDVAMAGDDRVEADNATQNAFSRFVNIGENELNGISSEDIRYAMTSIAAGAKLDDLRWKISAALFAILQANTEQLAAERAMSALTEYFDIDETEFEREEYGPAVFGASLVHFPKTLKTRTRTLKRESRYNPVSSHSLR